MVLVLAGCGGSESGTETVPPWEDCIPDVDEDVCPAPIADHWDPMREPDEALCADVIHELNTMFGEGLTLDEATSDCVTAWLMGMPLCNDRGTRCFDASGAAVPRGTAVEPGEVAPICDALWMHCPPP